MNEQRLQTILQKQVEAPDIVNERLKNTYEQLERTPRPVRRPPRTVRALLLAAVLSLLLCGTAVAASAFLRLDVPVDSSQTAQGIGGGGQPSWSEQTVTDGAPDGGVTHHYPNRETVPADPALTQGLLGAYLPENGYQWQIEDYTFTVEGYVLDERTSTAKFYYTVEHPGGFGEDAVDWAHGLLNDAAFPVSIDFLTGPGEDADWFGGRIYADTARSAPEKLCLTASMAAEPGWKAENGLTIRFCVRGALHTENQRTWREDPVQTALLELPGAPALPTAEFSADNGAALTLSAIGMCFDCEDIDTVRRVKLECADGTSYVVTDWDSSLDNADYELGLGEQPNMTIHLVFNRIVDLSAVTAAEIDGVRYTAA